MSVVFRSTKIKNQRSGDVKTPVLYRDVSLGIDGTYDESLDKTGLMAVMSALNNIFLTKRGSRILDPSFGVDMEQFIHSQINERNAEFLEDEIRSGVEIEPRVSLIDVIVFVNKPESQYEATIVFTVPSISYSPVEATVSVGEYGVIFNRG